MCTEEFIDDDKDKKFLQIEIILHPKELNLKKFEWLYSFNIKKPLTFDAIIYLFDIKNFLSSFKSSDLITIIENKYKIYYKMRVI